VASHDSKRSDQALVVIAADVVPAAVCEAVEDIGFDATLLRDRALHSLNHTSTYHTNQYQYLLHDTT